MIAQELTGFLARFEERVVEQATARSRSYSPMKPAREAVDFTTLVATIGRNQLASEIARLENAETMPGGGAGEERMSNEAAWGPPPGICTDLGLSHQLRPIRMLTAEESKR